MSDAPISTALALTAALILATGASLASHLLFLVGLPLTIAGLIVACLAARRSDRADDRQSLRTIYLWLSVAAAIGVVGPSTEGPIWYEALRRAYFATGVLLVGLFSSGEPRWQRRATTIAIGLSVFLYAITPLETPNPQIDVFAWTQTAVSALLHGIHPYTVVAQDVYHGQFDFGYTVSVYPYMPATLLVYAPWVAAFGDFRFALAACLPLTIGLIHGIGRRLALDPQVVGVATLALVLNPDGPRVVKSGWSEPLLVAAAAAFVYFALSKPRGTGQAVVFFLLPALKQYFVAPVFLYLDRIRRGTFACSMLVGALAAAATVVPFLLWNWRATVAGIVFQMQAPTGPRLGSTSLVAMMATVSDVYPGRWASVMMQFVVAALAWWRLRDRGLSGLLLASALSLYATFLTGWQAFVNYYYFVSALLVLAALVASSREVVA